MKNINYLIFVFVLLSYNSLNSQTWKYKTDGNPFDGEYKVAMVQGKNEYKPSSNPMLVINLFNEETLNFFIGNTGHYSSESNVEVLWVFDNEPKTIYKSEELSLSEDGKTIFFDTFKNTITDDYLYEIEFIEKLKSGSKVDVRIKNKYEKNDIVFSLVGSTKAINYVISKKYKEHLIDYKNELKKSAIEELDRRVKVAQKIYELLFSVGVYNSDEWSNIYDRIEYNFKIDNLNLGDIDSISVKPKNSYIEFILYNIEGDIIKEVGALESNIPEYFKKMQNEIKIRQDSLAKIEEEEKTITEERLSKLLDRYGLTFLEKKEVIDDIYLWSTIGPHYKLKDIDSISISKLFGRELGQIKLLNKNDETLNSLTLSTSVSLHTLNKIEKDKIEYISNKILPCIKKYNFTKRDEQTIIDNGIFYNTHFKLNIYDLEEIDIKPSEENSNNVDVIFKNKSGNALDTISLQSKSILTKIKNFKK
jgi:hypothetical protein